MHFTRFICLTLFSIFLFGNLWANSGFQQEWKQQPVFIENRGQFQSHTGSADDIRFAWQGEEGYYFFTPRGVVFELEKKTIKQKTEQEKQARKQRKLQGFTAEEFREFDRSGRKIVFEREVLRCEWMGTSPAAEIVPEEVASFYYSYTFYTADGKTKNVNQIPAYKKLRYRNLYPGIDVVYEIHPESGIKYSLHLQPGANPSLAQLQYSRTPFLLPNGALETTTSLGSFIDHPPLTFYAGNQQAIIPSSYKLQGDVIRFNLGQYNTSLPVVIDPWTQAPSFNTSWDCIWECERDAAGNVYAIGGVMPMQLLKYSPAGNLLWTYNTPYDTSNCWLGTFTTDNAGNSYVTAGSPAAIQKINTTGTVVWNNPSPGGLLGLTEFWNISFNCDQTALVIAGTDGLLAPPLPFIFNVNTSNGNVTNSVQVHAGQLFPTQEVRAITACGNGKYYFLTHDSIGYIHQSLTSCLPANSFPFHISNGYSFGYKCEDWRVDNSGIEAIAYHNGFIYTHRGNILDKRDFATANVIASVNIPGGGWNTGLGGNSVASSGIDIDDCGNIYVGATNGVVKFNTALQQLATYPTNFRVYDVQVNVNGEIIAAGSTGTASGNSARQGYVQTFAASACAPIATVCCDATLCPAPAKCLSDAPFTITAVQPGGTFSGPGITNASTGLFSPTVAGIGVHTILYTLPCGVDSIRITVNACTPISVCRLANGELSVTGGTGPYTWSQWGVNGQQCVGGILIGSFCTGTLVNTFGWVTFGTGASIAPPPGADSVRVVDNAGTEFISWNINTLPACTPCPLTISGVTFTAPACNQSNGSINVQTAGSTGPLSWVWSPNVSTSSSATGLAAGVYQITVTDVNAGCSQDTVITLSPPAGCCAILYTQQQQNPTCAQLNGGWADVDVVPVAGNTYSYQWTPNVSTTDSAANLAAGNYQVIITQNTGGGLQTDTLYRETFNNGATAWTLNNGTGNNQWVVNNVYAGGPCTLFGFPLFTIPNVPNQPIAITGWPTSQYLHIRATTNSSGCGAPFPPQNANFDDSEPTTQYAVMNNNINTTGYSNVRLRFWWIGAGNNACYGAVQYSTNNGTSWNQIGTNLFNGGVWTPVTLTDPALNNQAQLKFRFVWTNGSGGSDPAISIDQVEIMGDINSPGSSCSDTADFQLITPVCCSHALAASVSQPGCTSPNGSINLTVTGGTGPFSFQWAPGGQTTEDITGLAAGTYSVSVTDQSNGCVVDSTFMLSAPAVPAINSVSFTSELCAGQNNGSIDAINVSGGTAPYSFGFAPLSNPLSVTPVVSFPVTNLAPGLYIVGVTDQSGCLDTFWISIPAGPVCCNLSISAVLQQPDCGVSNGAIDVTVGLGSGSYSYSWSNGSVTEDITALNAGLYSITVSDPVQGCSVDSTFSLSNLNAPQIQNIQVTAESCTGAADGSIQLTVTGGVLPYGYAWSPALPANANQANLTPGNYSLTVTDAAGCQSVQSFVVNPGAKPDAAVTGANPDCSGNNGSVTVTLNTACVSCSFSLNGGGFGPSATFTGLGGGTYTVIVQDGLGCRDTVSQTLTAPVLLTASLSTTDLTCFNAADGGAAVITSSGTPPFDYSWNTGATTAALTGLSAGNYSVTVTDASGCSSTLSGTLSEPAELLVSLGPDVFLCAPDYLLTTGLGTGFTFAWSNGTTASEFTVTQSGTYEVTVTDADGCTADEQINVQLYDAVTINLPDQFTVYQGQSVALNPVLTGGSGTGTWSWSPGDDLSCTACAAPVATPDADIVYTVSYTDNAGCVASDQVAIDVQSSAIYIPDAFTPNGDGQNDVFGIYGIGIRQLEWRVFNRWGEKVFETRNPADGWDGVYKGKEQPVGVYVYYALITLENGKTENYQGSVTLLR